MNDLTPPAKRTAKDFATDQEVRWCPGCGDYAILRAVQKTLADIEATMTMIAEGVFNAKTAKHLADTLNVEAPITTEVYRILYEGVSPAASMETLLSRDPKPE